MTLMASQTLLLMFLESFDQLEKLSMRTLLMWLYFNFLFRSKSLASLPEMNFNPFTSYPSPQCYSSKPPRANPRSSTMAAPRSKGRTGMRHSSSLFIYIQFIRLAPMLEQNFSEHVHHLDGCSVHITANQRYSQNNCSNFYSFGSDDIAYHYDCATRQANSSSITNTERQEITALTAHPKHGNTFVVGTAKGFVRLLRPVNKFQLQKAQVLYKCDQPIKSLSFHPSGKFVGIAFDNQQAFVYSLKDKRIYSLSQGHEGGCMRIFFGGSDYVCSQGFQGNLNIYDIKQNSTTFPGPQQQSQSEDPFADTQETFSSHFLDKYRIASESITKKYPFFNAVYANIQTSFSEKMILASGQTYLQIINLSPNNSSYRIEKSIREQEEILIVEVLPAGEGNAHAAIVTSTVSSLSIWNYERKEKLLTVNTLSSLQGTISSIARLETPEGPSFIFTVGPQISNGKIYQFINQHLLQSSAQEQKPEKAIAPKKEFVSRWEESKLEKLIPDYTQFLMEKSYEEYQNAQFLFYNNFGCIIQRIQGDSSTLELQHHDKSRPKRINLQAKNRPFCRFALRQDIFVAATTMLVVFQCEKHLKQGFSSWEFRWNDIQSVSIGADWIAVCSEDEIKILDYAGNQLHSICFDRRFVTMEAYEDMLAIVYHGGVPMWGCQALKMRLYQINVDKVKLQRDVLVPLKPNSLLKWFGFSEEGMIYCQDTLQVIKGYIYERDEWQAVHSLENSTDRLYIQHISGTDIYGFKLQQKQGEKVQPRVLPRSLPRKIPMQLPCLPIKFLEKSQQVYLKKVRLRNIQIAHEEFRHNRWYKFKYSRSKNHLWASYSKGISSAEEIKTSKALLDMQLIDYLKQLLKQMKEKEGTDYEQAMRSLMLIVERETHFQETKQAARKLLQIGTKYQKSHLFEDSIVNLSSKREKCMEKLNQISILQKMANLMEIV